MDQGHDPGHAGCQNSGNLRRAGQSRAPLPSMKGPLPRPGAVPLLFAALKEEGRPLEKAALVR